MKVVIAFFAAILPAASTAAIAEDPTIVHLAFESPDELAGPLTNDGARWQPTGPGPVDLHKQKQTAAVSRANKGSLEFDGKTAIVQLDLGKQADGLQKGFTWEGFFLTPTTNSYDVDGAIADRFLTQFIKETPGSTRLTVGLAAMKKGGPPVLCIALAATTNRHDGRFPVAPGVWHHFAVVHKGEGDYGKLSWYLDYELEGEITLTGNSARTTLKPSGREPIAIGARLKDKAGLNRGFTGLLDEIRLTAESLEPDDFLRAGNVGKTANFERTVIARLYNGLPNPFDWKFDGAKAQETVPLEALSFSVLPIPFSQRGYKTKRNGTQAIRAQQTLTLPKGDVRFLLRTQADALLTVDGKPLIDARGIKKNHPLASLPTQPRDYVATFAADGKPRRFELAAAYAAGRKNQLGEVTVCYSTNGGSDWTYLGHPANLRVSPVSLAQFNARTLRAFQKLEPQRRKAAVRRGNQIWEAQHASARQIASEWDVPQPGSDGNSIDWFIDRKLAAVGEKPASLTDDAAFARRLSLDLRGRIPTLEELQAFLNDNSADKRIRLIDAMLDSDEWADGWVGYWQDVLAENPDILKPTLNNSGPFRRWIHSSFRRNLPMDRFATELILMEGGNDEAGTAGFAQASMNDSPMAMKANVVLRAFAAVDLQCARCHDSPVTDLKQSDLFSLAALLNEGPLKVPATSVVPPVLPGGHQPAVTASLKVGQSIAPAWTLDGLIPSAPLAAQHSAKRPRAQLADILTSPHSTRFSDVIVNRTWKRFLGIGLIEPVDSWNTTASASHPDLLRFLSWTFVDSGYNMKQLVRTIVTSRTYQRRVTVPGNGDETKQPTFAGQTRRRMTGEQVVDSLHSAVGREFDAEELTFDPNRTRGFLNLGVPRRAWQMTSMSNERDRPALSMPVNQSIVDVLKTFGWRERRPNPLTDRDHEPNPLQPLMMANSMMSSHLVRLTEDSSITELCLSEGSPEELTARLFLATLSREANDEERAVIADLIRPEFDKRRTGKPKPKIVRQKRARVDWDKHLSPEATVELLEAERLARLGPPATVRLTKEFRERVEDALWCLINSPEFVFVP